MPSIRLGALEIVDLTVSRGIYSSAAILVVVTPAARAPTI